MNRAVGELSYTKSLDIFDALGVKGICSLERSESEGAD